MQLGIVLNVEVPDIRDTAVSVNDRLKKLIIPQDDEDYATDKNATMADPMTLSMPQNAVSVSSSPQSQLTGHVSSTPTPVTVTSSHSTGTTGKETQDATKTTLKSDSPKMGRASPKAGRTVTKPVSQSPNMTRKSGSSISGAKEGEGGEVEREEKESRKEEVGSGLREPRLHLLAVLGVLIPHMKYTLTETRMETLRWLMWLHQQLPKRVSE